MYNIDDYGLRTFHQKPIKRGKQNMEIINKNNQREDLRKSLESNCSRKSQRKGIRLSKHLKDIEKKKQFGKKEIGNNVLPFRRIQNQQSNNRVFQLKRPQPIPILIVRHQTVLKQTADAYMSTHRRSLTPCVRIQAINASPHPMNQTSQTYYKRVSLRSCTTRESTQGRIQDIPGNRVETRKPSIINEYFRGSIIDDLKSFALIPSKKIV